MKVIGDKTTDREAYIPGPIRPEILDVLTGRRPYPRSEQVAAEVAARRAAAKEKLDRERARHAELLHSDDRLVVHLVELHAPDNTHSWPVCQGCDHEGYESEPPSWPCRTWSLLAEEVQR